MSWLLDSIPVVETVYHAGNAVAAHIAGDHEEANRYACIPLWKNKVVTVTTHDQTQLLKLFPYNNALNTMLLVWHLSLFETQREVFSIHSCVIG